MIVLMIPINSSISSSFHAICDGTDILIPGIMEHFERTGVHSGDSCTSYPPYDFPQEVIDSLVDHTKRIARALHVVGLMNVQFAWDGDKIYVIEVNPRASRTVPILSKVTKVPMVRIAVAVMTGQKLKDMEYGTGLYPDKDYYAVKVPVFSDSKLTDVDVAVGPEMKSTGEVLGIDPDLDKAIYKGFIAAGGKIPTEGGVFVSLRDHDKNAESAGIVQKYKDLGFRIYASKGTGKFLTEHGVENTFLPFEDVVPMIENGIEVLINTPKAMNKLDTDTFPIRRAAIEHNLPVLTCMDTAQIFTKAVELKQKNTHLEYNPL